VFGVCINCPVGRASEADIFCRNFGVFRMKSLVQSVGQGIGVQFPAKARDFTLLYNAQTCSGAHPVSYATDTGGSVLGDKAAGT
jgi:hypothetical protein